MEGIMMTLSTSQTYEAVFAHGKAEIYQQYLVELQTDGFRFSIWIN